MDPTFDVTLITGSDIDSEHLQIISDLQASDARLAGPYFSAGFVELVASLSDNVRLGLVHRRGRVVAALPFQVRADGSGEPLSHPASDFHALLAAPEIRLDAERLILGCGLRSWDFHHLLTHQETFRPHHTSTRSSPYLDLSRGFDGFVRDRTESGTRQVRQIEASRLKLLAEQGELRFVPHTADPLVLARLREWKEETFRRKGIDKEFSPWQWSLLQALSRTETDDLAGMLSALFVGDELVAAHIGMRSKTRWHYWYPSFNPRFARYQPGLILLLEMARLAPSLGVTRIDLGTGDEPYKARLANGSELVARGRVDARKT